MKIFIVFLALLAVASTSHLYLAREPVIVAAVSNQYHSQDGIGQYAYGYNDYLPAKQEIKSLDGNTRGSYSYIDSNNVLQTVDYIADAGGFRVAATNLLKPVEISVVAAQNLPKQVDDTYEVAVAKSAHLSSIEEAKKQAPEVSTEDSLELPRPVQEIPEVSTTNTVHSAAIEETKKQNAQKVLISSPLEVPIPVEDQYPEVAKAKAEHLNALEQALLNVASASDIYLAPEPLKTPVVLNQYHAQDGYGRYAYGYNDHLSSKQEIKSLDGIIQGSYSYVDSNNVLQTVDYTADADGFLVDATNLPKAVEAQVFPVQDLPKQVDDTYEVAAAKSAHFAAIEEAKKQAASEVLLQAPFELPQSGADTPDVVAAKAVVHLATIKEAKKQNAELDFIPAAADLPRPVEDTPKVAKAKAELFIPIEEAKLRNSYQKFDSGIPLVQNDILPLVVSPSIPLSAHSSVAFQSSGGFSYSSSIVNNPIVQYFHFV